MAFSDKHQTDDELTITYHHPSWDEASFWKFAKFRTLEDSDEYDDLVKQIGEGKPTAQTVAFLVRHSRGWGGPDNTLSNSFRQPVRDEEGNVVKDPKTGGIVTEPHPLRGQIPPDTLEWIKKQEVSGDALLWLLGQYGVRTQEDEKRLPESSGSVAPDSGLPDGREEEVPVSAATA